MLCNKAQAYKLGLEGRQCKFAPQGTPLWDSWKRGYDIWKEQNKNKPSISKERVEAVKQLLSHVITFDRVEEFQYRNELLFQSPPEKWSDLERDICDYQVRIEKELREGLELILNVKL